MLKLLYYLIWFALGLGVAEVGVSAVKAMATKAVRRLVPARSLRYLTLVKSFREIQAKVTPLLKRLPADQWRRLYRFFTDPKNIQSLGLRTSALVAGSISVGYALLFRTADSLFHRLLDSFGAGWSVAFTPALFLLTWYLVRRFSPEAAGSGIPQIMAANEMEYRL